MTSSAPPRTRMGDERQSELFAAVLELLLEVGYERLTLDAVATRAHSSKATLYRLWSGKLGLVTAALRSGHVIKDDQTRRALDNATSLDELFALMSVEAGASPGRDMRMAFTLMRAASENKDFGDMLRECLLDPAVATMTGYFEQAADRGEIVRDAALFRLLATTIIEHSILRGTFDGGPDTAARRQVFFTTIIRPALTFVGGAPGADD